MTTPTISSSEPIRRPRPPRLVDTLRAEVDAQRAEAETQRAEAERLRAEMFRLEAELGRRPIALSELRAEVDNLQERLAASRDNHVNDIRRIGVAMIAEADRRQWCPEYDQFIDSVNDGLTVKLPRRDAPMYQTILVRAAGYGLPSTVCRTVREALLGIGLTEVRIRTAFRPENQEAEDPEDYR